MNNIYNDKGNVIEDEFNDMKKSRFELICQSEIIVPQNYLYHTQLNKMSRIWCYGFNDDLTDSNFQYISRELKPGSKYLAKIFQINGTVDSEECMRFLQSLKSVYIGAPDLSMIFEENMFIFPVGKWTVAFDKNDFLFTDSYGRLRIPGIYLFSANKWKFSLRFFTDIWFRDSCLLCLISK